MFRTASELQMEQRAMSLTDSWRLPHPGEVGSLDPAGLQQFWNAPADRPGSPDDRRRLERLSSDGMTALAAGSQRVSGDSPASRAALDPVVQRAACGATFQPTVGAGRGELRRRDLVSSWIRWSG